MIKVSNRFYLGLKIDGKDVPLEALIFDSLQLHSNEQWHCPIGNISLIDEQRYFEKNPVGDGVRFEIYVGTTKDSAKAKNYKFRHFKTEQSKRGPSISAYNFRLIYDCPRFMNESLVNAAVGNSSEVFKNLVAQVPFNKAVIDPSSDSMTWMPFGKKRCDFARHVAEHAYANTTSCFLKGITINGVFQFRNITTIDLTKTKTLLVKGSSNVENSIKVLDEKEAVNSGVNNAVSGYKLSTIEQATSGDSVFSKVQVPTASKQLMLNQNISKGIETSTFIATPIKSSNIHPNFQNASHQNTRIKNTYALNTFIATDEMTDLDLFDPVIYLSVNQAQGKVQVNPKFSGAYLVFAKTIYATRTGLYYEKFRLARQGYNLDSVSPSQIKSTLQQ